MGDTHDSVAVCCIGIALAGERQCAGVEGTDVGWDLAVEADTEAAVAAAPDHYFVSDLDNIRLYWRKDSRSIVDDPQERVFAPLRTIFEPLRRMGRSWFAFDQRAAEKLGYSSSGTFLAAEKLQIYSRMPHLFGRMHGRSC